MPVAPTFPGVYIEEIPSGVRSIAGVSTSIAAFVDRFRRGPLDTAVRILSFADFEREFGGLDSLSEASYAIRQFFLNGGTEAYVVRVGAGTSTASVVLTAGANDIVRATAGRRIRGTSEPNPGTWANALRIDVDFDTADPDETVDPDSIQDPAEHFNLTITETFLQGGRTQVRQTEVFRNVTMRPGARNHAVEVVNEGSRLVQLDRAGLATPLPVPPPDPPIFAGFRPVTTGTLSGPLPANLPVVPDLSTLNLTLDPGGGAATSAHVATLNYGGIVPQTYADFEAHLEAAIQGAAPGDPLLTGATVTLVGGDHYEILLDATANSDATLTLDGVVATHLQLTAAEGAVVGAQHPGTLGAALGALPDPAGATLDLTLDPGGGGLASAHTTLALPAAPASFAALRTDLETAIQGALPGDPLLAGATVELVNGDSFRVLLDGTAPADASVELTGPTADLLNLSTASGAVVGPQTQGTVGDVLPPPPALGGPVVPDNSSFQMTVDPGGGGLVLPAATVTLAYGGATPDTYPALRPFLQAAIRAADPNNPLFAGATVQLIRNRFRVLLGRTGAGFHADATATFAGPTAIALGLAGLGSVVSVQQFELSGGNDGGMPGDAELRGTLAAKTGMYALEDIDLFNILCLPRAADLAGVAMRNTYSEAETYCLDKRAFLIVDIPENTDDLDAMETWLADNATLRHRNAAVYFPRVRVSDPLNQNRLRAIGASGTMAGLYARTDANRGVWKAPAGTDDGRLRSVQDLVYPLTDRENGVLNPLGINALRNFPVYSNVAWGARTLDGSNQQASEWKYIPVRRFALFLEESLFRGTQWVVFEPNDEPLWAQIRLNVGAFMQRLFRQGAFQGQTAKEAYLVKCDRETTTQADIDLGIVNIVVGFAPLKPAEFVIIQIQQLAGQIPT